LTPAGAGAMTIIFHLNNLAAGVARRIDISSNTVRAVAVSTTFFCTILMNSITHFHMNNNTMEDIYSGLNLQAAVGNEIEICKNTIKYHYQNGLTLVSTIVGAIQRVLIKLNEIVSDAVTGSFNISVNGLLDARIDNNILAQNRANISQIYLTNTTRFACNNNNCSHYGLGLAWNIFVGPNCDFYTISDNICYGTFVPGGAAISTNTSGSTKGLVHDNFHDDPTLQLQMTDDSANNVNF
jgi:hypothetical protein